MHETITAEEATLVERARGGEQAAWAEVYRAAQSGLRSSARRRGAGRDEADDVVSEVFVRAIGGIGRYTADLPFTAWLHGIQRNVLREQARRRTAEPVGLDPSSGLSPDDDADPGRLAVRAAEGAAAVAALRRLDDRARLTVYLRVCEGFSSEEVAKVTGQSPAVVRGGQSRAIASLRRALQAEELR